MNSILQAEGSEFDKLRQALNEILDQYFASTATWWLDTWEQELGLAVSPDQPIEQRRDKIKSRLRGYGTATVKLIQIVAEAYDKGRVDVIENIPAYTVTIKFVDTTGIPPNLEDLKAAVRAVLPAHLDLVYEFNYFVWDELDSQTWSWDQFDSQAFTWDALEVYK
jgi:hypothetical protein